LRERDGVRAFWLDGRETLKGGSMALVTRRVGESNAPEVVVDGDVCSCCQTSAAMTRAGPIVVYRDHRDGEIRDISIVRRTKDGWTDPAPVHRDGWEIPGCPVNGPSADSSGSLSAVAWYTCAGGKPRVLVAFSRDDGASFAPPIVIDDARPLGRVSVACVAGGAAVCWLARRGERAAISLCRVTTEGSLGEVLVLGTTGASRAAGFPRMVRSGNSLVLVWRELADVPRLRSALVDALASRKPIGSGR
ncbi:MAG: hypothetical protein ACE5EV_02025, partial [Gaiellales bacterium]